MPVSLLLFFLTQALDSFWNNVFRSAVLCGDIPGEVGHRSHRVATDVVYGRARTPWAVIIYFVLGRDGYSRSVSIRALSLCSLVATLDTEIFLYSAVFVL
jgi:hypothetical protein